MSEALGYTRNGTTWATRRGKAAELLRWRMTRDEWARRRRTDIELSGVRQCKPILGL